MPGLVAFLADHAAPLALGWLRRDLGIFVDPQLTTATHGIDGNLNGAPTVDPVLAARFGVRHADFG